MRFSSSTLIHGLLRLLSGKGSACQCRRCGLNPWLAETPWRRKWQPTPVFLPGRFHGQRSLAGYSPWGHKRIRHDLATKQQQPLIQSWRKEKGETVLGKLRDRGKRKRTELTGWGGGQGKTQSHKGKQTIWPAGAEALGAVFTQLHPCALLAFPAWTEKQNTIAALCPLHALLGAPVHSWVLTVHIAHILSPCSLF